MADHHTTYRTLKGLQEELRPLAKSDVQLGDAAIRALDESLADARAVIGDEDSVASRVMDLVSPEAAAAGDLRGQRRPNPRNHRTREAPRLAPKPLGYDLL